MAFVLIGFMGAGKSTVAGELAVALGSEALDSDALLAERFGHPIADEFELNGEQAFRAAEEELVCELLERADPRTVIALGGGSVLSERVRGALADHVTVLLDVDAETAWERVSASEPAQRVAGGRWRATARSSRPARERRELYEELADATLTDLPIGGAARAAGALRALAAAPAGTHLLWASSASGEYPVLVGRGLLGDGETPLDQAVWPLDRSRSRAFCVSDETVAALYSQRLGAFAGTSRSRRGRSRRRSPAPNACGTRWSAPV